MVDQVIFDTIKEWVIKFFKEYDNQFGYVDGKIEQVNNIKNGSEYSAILILNSCHVLIRRTIIYSVPINVISYICEHSKDIYDIVRDDEELHKYLKRYRIIEKVCR